MNSRAAQWADSGVRWQLHRGPAHDKSAARFDCGFKDREATLVIWTSGEAELDIGDVTTTGVITTTQYGLSTLADLATCLDGLLDKLISPHSEP